MRVTESTIRVGVLLVHVDANELDCGARRLPYPTCIGTIGPKGKINVWTPAASKPRGYRSAALAMLESVAVSRGLK